MIMAICFERYFACLTGDSCAMDKLSNCRKQEEASQGICKQGGEMKQHTRFTLANRQSKEKTDKGRKKREGYRGRES